MITSFPVTVPVACAPRVLRGLDLMVRFGSDAGTSNGVSTVEGHDCLASIGGIHNISTNPPRPPRCAAFTGAVQGLPETASTVRRLAMNQRVLLVMSPTRRLPLLKILENAGFQVFAASGLSEAQQKLDISVSFDLVCIDAELPDGN